MAQVHQHDSQPVAHYEIPAFIGMKPGPRLGVRAEAQRLEKLSFDRFDVEPLAATIGAEISGVQLANIDDATFEQLHQAWLEYKVVFFRNQNMDASQQVAFARRFGELEEHPFLKPSDELDEVVRFEKSDEAKGVENLWHSDVSWREIPAKASILRSIEVPRACGDTLFADMITAYEDLDASLKARIDSLQAVHDFTHSFGHLLDAEGLAEKQKEFPAVRHPIVRTHPETGRKILYVNSVFVSHIDGLDPDEGAYLLDILCRQAAIPEFQCRFRWDAGAIAMWDNRATQHYAASDYWPKRRVMERVAIIGDRPS